MQFNLQIASLFALAFGALVAEAYFYPRNEYYAPARIQRRGPPATGARHPSANQKGRAKGQNGANQRGGGGRGVPQQGAIPHAHARRPATSRAGRGMPHALPTCEETICIDNVSGLEIKGACEKAQCGPCDYINDVCTAPAR